MKKSKILFLIMAFALTFMVAINVKAAGTCVSKGGTLPDSCSSVTCGSATVPAQCSSVAYSSCCTWQDPTCGENEQLVAHECVPVEPTTPTTCPAGQELNTEGTACVACRDHYYKAGTGLACSYCNGTVNASKTYCDEKKSVTVTITASKKDNVAPGETVTLTVSKNNNNVTGQFSCTGGSGCSSFTCPSEGNGGNFTITATMSCSNCVVTEGSVVINCLPAEGTKVEKVVASPSTIYVSPGSTAGINLTAYDNQGRLVKANWQGSSHIAVNAGCQGSSSCGGQVTAVQCQTITETVTATGAGTNTGSAPASVTIVGFAEWSAGERVEVPVDKKDQHTRHEAETMEGDQGDRCVAYEQVDPKTGIGIKYNRCCESGTPLKYCYEKPDGSREVTTFKEGYVKKDEKYCEKACYKKSDGTYVNAFYEDGYEKVEDRLCDKTPTPHCYRTSEGTYVNEVYKEGYVQVDDAYCASACYRKPDGTTENTGYQEGYVKVDKKYCEVACYKTGEDKYERTTYKDGYEKVEDSKCADVPPTAATVSKIIYALSLFLVMAGSGIIVYQLTKTKKELG